jgi:hypothetical protein
MKGEAMTDSGEISRPKRKAIPVGVKLHACLLALGYTDEEIKSGIDWDHDPAIVWRSVNEAGDDLVPAMNDPHFIRPLRKATHKVKTFGAGGEQRISTRGSDVAEPRRLDKISAKHSALRTRLAQPGKAPKPRSKWPKRPFPKKAKK